MRRGSKSLPRRDSAAGVLACLGVLAGACGTEPIPELPAPPRPVTVFRLQERVPTGGHLATGIVEPFRQSRLGFEVPGTLRFVRDVGKEVDGPQLDGQGELLLGGDGAPVRIGDVLAEIDDTRYRQALAAVELRLQSTERQLVSQRIDLERQASADLESARAQAEAARIDVASAQENVSASEASAVLARSTVQRHRELVASGNVSQSVLDQHETDQRTAEARLEQARAAVDAAIQVERSALAQVAKAEGAIEVKAAQIDATLASLAELENERERARTDVEACILRAPYSGRVTEVHVATGAFVGAGQAIVDLVLLAPIKVVFTASAAQNHELLVGMGVRVRPNRADSAALADPAGVVGTVVEKSDVADPATRTFAIGIMVPNPVLGAGVDVDPSRAKATPVTDVFPVLLRGDGTVPELLVNVACLLEEEGSFAVLRLPDLQLHETRRDLARRYVPERVPVVPNNRWAQIDRWTLRGLADASDLAPGQALVVDPGAHDLAGLTFTPRRRSFHPGDVVGVELEVALPPAGLWVPVSAIRERNGRTSLVRAVDGAARIVDVTVHDAFGELRRVESAELAAGDLVVAAGTHYLADGERIEIVEGPGSR